MLSSDPATTSTLRPAASSSDASSVAPVRPERCAASSGGEAERLRGLGAEQAGARHGLGDDAALDPLQRVRNRRAGDCSRCLGQGGQQGWDRAGGNDRSGGVMHQHDVGRVRHQRFQPRAHAVLPGGAAGDARQTARHASQQVIDLGAVAYRLQQRRLGGQRLGGVADHRLAGQRQELLRDVGAKAASRSGGNKDSGDTHDAEQCPPLAPPVNDASPSQRWHQPLIYQPEIDRPK